MPFLFAASLLGILWAGSKSGWRTEAQIKAGEPGVHGLATTKRWMTWAVAWQGQKSFVGPLLVDAEGIRTTETALRVMKPGATLFRFALVRGNR